MKSLFISPHFDDAIFSCGKLISILKDSTVLTVFGGMPTNKAVCTAYDQKSGFGNAEEAIIARREEDSVAVTALGAEQRYLEYVENQYGEAQDLTKLRKELEKIIEEYDEIYYPLGMKHPDHEMLGNMCQAIETKDKKFYVYADLPYYVDDPELFAERRKSIPDKSYIYRGGDLGKKAIGFSMYKSQMPIMNLYHLLADERYYV